MGTEKSEGTFGRLDGLRRRNVARDHIEVWIRSGIGWVEGWVGIDRINRVIHVAWSVRSEVDGDRVSVLWLKDELMRVWIRGRVFELWFAVGSDHFVGKHRVVILLLGLIGLHVGGIDLQFLFISVQQEPAVIRI